MILSVVGTQEIDVVVTGVLLIDRDAWKYSRVLMLKK